MIIYNFIEELAPGNIIVVVLADNQQLITRILGVDLSPETRQKIQIEVPRTDMPPVVAAMPAPITNSLLLEHGFIFATGIKGNEYSLQLNGNTFIRVRPNPKNPNRFVTHISQFIKKDKEVVTFVGQFAYFFNLQNLYSAYTNKKLTWSRKI